MIKLQNPVRPVIIALVGASGSGKTTIANELHNADIIPTLVSYTTRPIRDNETDGIDHHFVSETDMPDRNTMLAYTYFGGNHYWTSLSDLERMKEYPHIYVIDEKGVLDLYELQDQGVIDVLWVQVIRDNISVDTARADRDKEREEYLELLHSQNKYPDITIYNNKSIKEAAETLLQLLKTKIPIK